METAAARLERLGGEYARLETAGEEEAVADALSLQDLQLLKVPLAGLWERYEERLPNMEEVAERYEAEIDELSVEIQRLREENALLALQPISDRSLEASVDASFDGAGLGEAGSASSPWNSGGRRPRRPFHQVGLESPLGRSRPCPSVSSSTPRAWESSTPRVLRIASPRPSPSPGRSPAEHRRRETQRAQEAAAAVLDEVRDSWSCQAEADALRRRTQVNEWYLSLLRAEMQAVAQKLNQKEAMVRQMRKRLQEADAVRQQITTDELQGWEDLEAERLTATSLHREALSLREACVVPAVMKKKSSVLTQGLDQAGSKVEREHHLRALQTCAKLYQEVCLQAEHLEPLANHAKSFMEAEFARFQELQKQHSAALDQIQLGIMRSTVAETGVGKDWAPLTPDRPGRQKP